MQNKQLQPNNLELRVDLESVSVWCQSTGEPGNKLRQLRLGDWARKPWDQNVSKLQRHRQSFEVSCSKVSRSRGLTTLSSLSSPCYHVSEQLLLQVHRAPGLLLLSPWGVNSQRHTRPGISTAAFWVLSLCELWLSVSSSPLPVHLVSSAPLPVHLVSSCQCSAVTLAVHQVFTSDQFQPHPCQLCLPHWLTLWTKLVFQRPGQTRRAVISYPAFLKHRTTSKKISFKIFIGAIRGFTKEDSSMLLASFNLLNRT